MGPLDDHLAVRVPSDGYPTVVVLDGSSTVILWGQGPAGEVLIASDGHRLLTWDTLEDCLTAAIAHGWELAEDHAEAPSGDTVLNCDAAQEWLRGSISFVDVASSLDMWNLATDVAHTLALPFPSGGRLANNCHTKLTASNVPSAFGVESYKPRWSAAESRVLRRVLSEAVHVLRVGLGR